MTIHLNYIRAKLRERLRANGYRTGEFVLSSGRPSTYLLDCKPVLLTAEGHALVAKLFTHMIKDLPVSYVAGVELGGCPIASAVAMYSHLSTYRDTAKHVDAVYVRKAPKGHGSARRVEGTYVPGGGVFLAEDVVTTGASTLRAIEALVEAGLKVVRVGAVLDREEGGTEALAAIGVPLSALFKPGDFR